jgi:hypothetical protein
MKKGFRHCYFVRNDFDSVWTVVNPGRSRMYITQELVSEYPTIQDYLLAGETAIAYNVKPCYRAHNLSVVSCVGAVKYLLGIHAAHVLTPYQLYKYLLPRGELIT